MPNPYRGMRWLKCDLQMQTPADARHWAGDRLEAGQEAAAAKAFAEACYQQRLDVVGITDHNFLSKDFIPHLQAAFAEIEREFSHKITLFPGLELEADVGKGMHVLCLFEPGTSTDDIDHILTECGVGRPRIQSERLAKSTKRLPDILSVVQKPNPDGTWRGIVIVPHVFEDSLFDNGRISEWLQQEEYRNPDLLAVEVPKPVSRMSDAFQKLFRSGDDCYEDWKRIRPIATIMSSDNKKLVDLDEHQKPTPNSIGYRYSWLKMSEPSIESLRQAFLDHESRIILPEDVTTDTHPAQRVRQATIKSISIKNVAFLADQVVHFSPNLNCVIGGRGSGKSTLLEYLRIILGKDKSKDLDDGTKERINRVRETLNVPGAEVEVCWVSADGVEDRIVWQNGNPTVQGRDLADPETFFNSLPIRFYSQQQLNRLTESKADEGSVRQAQRLLELVDGFAKNELDELAGREHKLKLQIQDAFSNLRKAKTLEKDYKRLQQEHQELDRQWKARSEIQEDARRHQLLKAEARYLEGLLGTPGRQFNDVASLAETIAASHVAFHVPDSTHATWFRQFDDKVKAAKDALARTIRDAVEQFETAVEDLKTSDPMWKAIREELDQADAKFSEACAAKGLTPDDVGHLQEINQARAKKQREIDEIGSEIQRLKDAAGDTDRLMQQLHQIWREQFQKRVEAAERANELAVLREGAQRFIEVTAKYQQDHKSFRELWESFAPSDRRTRLGKNWESCGEILYTLFTGQEDAESPWQVLEERLSAEQGSAGPDFGASSQELFQHIQNNLERWENLRCSRVQDTVDMKLFRADGSTAGSIAEGSLSDGQRNTAALALLLAQEGGPLVIDQPEDELDSNFLYRELIPMLRKVKSKRQLIIATHNANLPVNGDAELVYAFEARDGKGEARACGGLDQASVTKAVLDIMEGTEEAFRRRREKYHF
jgi:energy-coupling factor transporter ATP-binding protein EcfA2